MLPCRLAGFVSGDVGCSSLSRQVAAHSVQLDDAFGWAQRPSERAALAPPPPHAAISAAEFSDEEVARLARANALDLELYAYAASLAERRTNRAQYARRLVSSMYATEPIAAVGSADNASAGVSSSRGHVSKEDADAVYLATGAFSVVFAMIVALFCYLQCVLRSKGPSAPPNREA